MEEKKLDECLESFYIIVDWTHSDQLIYPDLTDITPVLSTKVSLKPSGQSNCYIVNSLTDGNYLLGIIIQRWYGTRGFCFSTPSPVELRY